MSNAIVNIHNHMWRIPARKKNNQPHNKNLVLAISKEDAIAIARWFIEYDTENTYFPVEEATYLTLTEAIALAEEVGAETISLSAMTAAGMVTILQINL